MENQLLFLERYILESIGKKNKTINEICLDTDLPLGIVFNTLQHLLLRKIVDYEKAKYKINFSATNFSLLKCDENIKAELCEMFSSITNTYISNQREGLRLRKVWLDPKQEKFLNAMLLQVDNFLENVERDRKKMNRPSKHCTRLSEKKVVFWGRYDYNLIKDTAIKEYAEA